MNNITKAIIGTTLAIGSIFGGVQSAQAADCVYGNGFQICFDSNGNNNWDVSLRNNNGTENMTVQCDGKSVSHYNSYGPFSKSETNYLADYFCSL